MQTRKNIVAVQERLGRASRPRSAALTFYEASTRHAPPTSAADWLPEKGNPIYVYTNEESSGQIGAAVQEAASPRSSASNYLNATGRQEPCRALRLRRDGGPDSRPPRRPPTSPSPDKSPTSRDDLPCPHRHHRRHRLRGEHRRHRGDDPPDRHPPLGRLSRATILQTSSPKRTPRHRLSRHRRPQFTTPHQHRRAPRRRQRFDQGGTGSSTGGLSPLNNQGTAVVSPRQHRRQGRHLQGRRRCQRPLDLPLQTLDEVTDFRSSCPTPGSSPSTASPPASCPGTRVGYLSTTSTDTSTTQTVVHWTQLCLRLLRRRHPHGAQAAGLRLLRSAPSPAQRMPPSRSPTDHQELVTNVNVRDADDRPRRPVHRQPDLHPPPGPLLGDIPVIGACVLRHDDKTDCSGSSSSSPDDRGPTRPSPLPPRRPRATWSVQAGSRRACSLEPREDDRPASTSRTLAREASATKALWLVQFRSRSTPASRGLPPPERITGKLRCGTTPAAGTPLHDDATKRLGGVQTQDPGAQHRTPWGLGRPAVERTKNPGSVVLLTPTRLVAYMMLTVLTPDLQNKMNVSPNLTPTPATGQRRTPSGGTRRPWTNSAGPERAGPSRSAQPQTGIDGKLCSSVRNNWGLPTNKQQQTTNK